MCVVCVYFVFYKTIHRRGANRHRIQCRTQNLAPRQEKNTGYRTRHASAASGVIP